jgi:hypothetical protein
MWQGYTEFQRKPRVSFRWSRSTHQPLAPPNPEQISIIKAATYRMSGIEVAGLILGSFPLLISALEHYRQSAEALGVFWKIRREHKVWVHDLRICELAFERNLEALLLPLIIDDDAVQDLIGDPGEFI